MTTVSPLALGLARQVLLHEAGSAERPAALAAAAERAYEQLGQRLAGLIGTMGFQALIARALRLAVAEVPDPALVTVDAQAAGRLRGLPAFVAAHVDDLAGAFTGLTAILAYLIGLLATFIGDPPAVRLVRESWPDLEGAAGDLEEHV